MIDAPSPLGGRLDPPSPAIRNLIIGFLGTTVVMGWVGSAIWATLIDRHPLALITLNSTPKFLVLASNSLDWWAYYPVAAIRNLITKPLMWLIGAWYGERAVAWAARRSETAGSTIRWLQARFGRIGWLVVPIVSSNPVCLLAGSAGMPLLLFVGLASIGVLVRLYLYRVFGATFAGPLADLTAFAVEHRTAAVLTSAAAVAVVLLIQHRSGRGGIEELSEMKRDLDPTPPQSPPPPTGSRPEGG